MATRDSHVPSSCSCSPVVGPDETFAVSSCRLSNDEVQMLMKMFDTLHYPLLTDYVRTCLSNSSR